MVRTPWLPFQGPIPPIRGKCPEGTKGVLFQALAMRYDFTLPETV